MSETFWKVAVEAPLPAALTYSVPTELLGNDKFRRGSSVRVPLGKRNALGILLGEVPQPEQTEFKIKPVNDLDDGRPHLPEPFLLWCEWLANYYLYPLGQVLETAFPPLERQEKARASKRKSVVPQFSQSTAPNLTDEQQQTIKAIQTHKGFATHLVHGVTGSGKTEIYMHLLEDLVARGEQGIVLVPEISLTPQLINRFSARLGDSVAVIHSHLTPREKTNQWWAMVENKKQILIGARSALFCPMPNLKMIVVDEEHEASFKQEEKLKYHARDAAIMLGKFNNCPVVLGSATPALESWSNAQEGKFKLHQLKKRVEDRPLPQIEVVDLREMRDKKKIDGRSPDLPFWLSQELFEAIHETLENKEQVALFLNRRGVAQSVFCPSCGYTPECPNCAVSLTLHGKNHLLCHYCAYHETMGEVCKDCKIGEPKPMGLGTELVENDIQKLFPEARLTRMDRDEINSREALEGAIEAIENREIDIIVGTQMIAKGLDFEGLTLVGLVLADVAFNLPDFRASERSFQLLTQVSGRSGRHNTEKPGRVIIQTYNPEHPSIQYTCQHDYENFANLELSFRSQLNYPPAWRLASVRIQGLDLAKVKDAAWTMKRRAEVLLKKEENLAMIEVLGPVESPLARLRSQYRYQVLLKGPDPQRLNRFCRGLIHDLKWLPPGVKVQVDVDAMNLL